MVALPFKPEDLQVFQTPSRVLGLMLQKETFSQADLRRMVHESMNSQRPYWYRPILYAMDHPDLDKAVCRNKKMVAVYRATLEKIRSEVAGVLREEGLRVFQLHETIEAVKHGPIFGDFRHTGWAHVAGHPDIFCKVRERFLHIAPRPEAFASPYVVPETVHATGQHLITIAPFDPSRHSLLDQYSRLTVAETSRLILDAMQGNVHMHEQGWSHNDIKPEHVEYTAVNGRRQGILADTEAAAPLGSTYGTISTDEYFDQHYYGGAHHSDQPRDVFAWGVTLAEYISPYPHIEWFDRSNMRGIDQQQIFERVDALFGSTYPPLVTLIKRMVQKNRQARPKLPEVIAELKGIKLGITNYKL